MEKQQKSYTKKKCESKKNYFFDKSQDKCEMNEWNK